MAISGARVRRLRRLRGLREDRLRDRRYARKPSQRLPGFQNRRGVPGRARTQDMGAQEHHFLDDDTGSLKVEIDVNNSDSRAKLR